MASSSTPPSSALTLRDLDDDLLDVVVRHCTGERNGGSARLPHFTLAAVSPAMRRVFYARLTALTLDSPGGAALAALGWAPLARCSHLRALTVRPRAGLSDHTLAQLLARLRAQRAPLRAMDVVLDKEVGQHVLSVLAALFGPRITRLRVEVSWVRRVRRRRSRRQHVFFTQQNPSSAPHAAPADAAAPPAASALGAAPGPHHHLQPGPAAIAVPAPSLPPGQAAAAPPAPLPPSALFQGPIPDQVLQHALAAAGFGPPGGNQNANMWNQVHAGADVDGLHPGPAAQGYANVLANLGAAAQMVIDNDGANPGHHPVPAGNGGQPSGLNGAGGSGLNVDDIRESRDIPPFPPMPAVLARCIAQGEKEDELEAREQRGGRSLWEASNSVSGGSRSAPNITGGASGSAETAGNRVEQHPVSVPAALSATGDSPGSASGALGTSEPQYPWHYHQNGANPAQALINLPGVVGGVAGIHESGNVVGEPGPANNFAGVVNNEVIEMPNGAVNEFPHAGQNGAVVGAGVASAGIGGPAHGPMLDLAGGTGNGPVYVGLPAVAHGMHAGIPAVLPGGLPHVFGGHGSGGPGDGDNDDDGGLGSPAVHTDSVIFTDDVFSAVVARCVNIRFLTLEGAKNLTNTGIAMLSRCKFLEGLVLSNLPLVTDDGLAPIVREAALLKVLHLRDMDRISEATLHALTVTPRAQFESLDITRNMQLTDQSIRLVVNSCEGLKSVVLRDCALLTNSSLSHLSCARNLEVASLEMSGASPVSNRSAIYLSCAAASLRVLSLGACNRMGVDGIIALSKLPGLVQLRLFGLGVVSQDSMRILGGNPVNSYPRLEHLVLDGGLQLTDLGVTVLCGQRGHRFVHLELLDNTRNLSDEALDVVGTWCSSLKFLRLLGSFSGEAVDQLRSNLPSSEVQVTMG